MAKYEVEEIVTKKDWEDFVLSQKPKTFLQSWYWGEVNHETGSKIFRLGFKRDGKLVGVCLAIAERARRGPHLVVPAGPILDWEDKKLVDFFVSTIRNLAVKEKVWFVRVRPELENTKECKNMFSKLRFISSPMHLHAENTWILDISKSEDEILSGMRKTTRYLVKKGLKSRLNLKISTDSKFAGVLYKLQKETIERHGFVGFPEKLFRKEVEIFGNDNLASYVVVGKGNSPLAIAIIIFYGESAYYHFSGSVSEFSKLPFSYFLQWEVIKEAKRRGKKFYNFWGIAPNDNPNHRFAGVTLFKTGFGGERIDWLHARDLVISPLYYFTYAFELLRKTTRRL